MTFRRDFANLFTDKASAVRTFEIGAEADIETAGQNAPGLNLVADLPVDQIEPGSLSIYRESDGYEYVPGLDFEEELPGSWRNLAIAEGTWLILDYAADNDETVGASPGFAISPASGWTAMGDPKPPAECRLVGDECLIRGVLDGGGTAETAPGTLLFNLPDNSVHPAYDEWLLAMSDLGALRLDVSDGEVRIGGGPACGSSWIILSGLRYPVGAATIDGLPLYPSESLYPSDSLYPHNGRPQYPSELTYLSDTLYPN